MTSDTSQTGPLAVLDRYDEHVRPIWTHLDAPNGRASGRPLEAFEGTAVFDPPIGPSVASAGRVAVATVEATAVRLESWLEAIRTAREAATGGADDA